MTSVFVPSDSTRKSWPGPVRPVLASVLEDVQVPVGAPREVDDEAEGRPVGLGILPGNDAIDARDVREERSSGELADIEGAVGPNRDRGRHRVGFPSLRPRREDRERRDVPVRAHAQEVVASGVGDDPAARRREDAVRVAVGHRALVGVVLGLVGRDVVVGEPGSIRLQANEPAEALPERRSEVRVRAEPDRHVGAASPVQRDVVGPRRPGAVFRRIGRQPGRDPLLGSVPES